MVFINFVEKQFPAAQLMLFRFTRIMLFLKLWFPFQKQTVTVYSFDNFCWWILFTFRRKEYAETARFCFWPPELQMFARWLIAFAREPFAHFWCKSLWRIIVLQLKWITLFNYQAFNLSNWPTHKNTIRAATAYRIALHEVHAFGMFRGNHGERN